MKKNQSGKTRFWKKIYYQIKNESTINKCKYIASLAVFITSIATPIYVTQLQMNHNENSLRPYINFEVGKYKTAVTVELNNVGVGPAIITNVKFIDNGKDTGKKNLYESIDFTQKYKYKTEAEEKNVEISQNGFKDYREDFIDTAVSVGDAMILLDFQSEDPDQIHAMRHALLDMEVYVEYEDIYDNKFKVSGDFSTFDSLFEY